MLKVPPKHVARAAYCPVGNIMRDGKPFVSDYRTGTREVFVECREKWLTGR